MRLIVFFFLIFLASLKGFAQASLNAKEVEPGVPEKLAAYRKEILSQINYELKLNIPAQKQQPITATEIIRVKILKNELPLQIDLRNTATT